MSFAKKGIEVKDVDYHTQVPPEVEVYVRNRCLVEAVSNGKVTAKAVRANDHMSWQVGAMISGHMQLFAEIHAWVPEVLARKMVLAILKEIG
jgi:hypothetical protein